MSLRNLLTATADIKRATSTADAMGGEVKSFAAIYSSIPCLIQPAMHFTYQGIREEFAKRSMFIDHVMYTTTAVSLVAGDIVVSNAITYLVREFGDSAGQGRLYTIYLEKKD